MACVFLHAIPEAREGFLANSASFQKGLFSFPESENFTSVTSLPTSAAILTHEGFISNFEILNIVALALPVAQPIHVLPTNVETSFVRAQLALQTYSLI